MNDFFANKGAFPIIEVDLVRGPEGYFGEMNGRIIDLCEEGLSNLWDLEGSKYLRLRMTEEPPDSENWIRCQKVPRFQELVIDNYSYPLYRETSAAILWLFSDREFWVELEIL